jgi:hypothetical protein
MLRTKTTDYEPRNSRVVNIGEKEPCTKFPE